MASSRNKGFTMRHPVIVDMVGCNCRPRFSSFSSLFSSHSKPKSTSSLSSSLSSTTLTTTTTATNDTWDPPSFTTNSLFYEPPFILNEGRTNSTSNGNNSRERKARRKKRGTGNRVRRESVPVTVDSNEPYEDFRESMVQMIVQKEIYAWDDLNELLHQFLSLNSPRHHPLILHAFADLWNGLFSPPSPCV